MMPFAIVDCGLLNHPKVVALPSDTARLGWVAVLLLAKQQVQPGGFASAKHFRHVMGRYGRFLPNYIAERLLDEDPDGRLLVHDWRDYQRDKTDNTSAERQRRYRERHGGGNGESNGGVTPSVTPSPNAPHAGGRAVPVPVSVTPPVDVAALRARRPDDRMDAESEPDALTAYHSLTGRFPTGRVLAWLNELAATHGDATVETALAEECQIDSAVHTLLSRTQNRLERDAHAAAKRREQKRREAEAEERARIEAMPLEQRQANIARLRGELTKIGLIGPLPAEGGQAS